MNATVASVDVDDHSHRDQIALDASVNAPESGRKYYIDFDHTLFLASSTEQFLNCARPGFVFALLLKLLGALRPWSIAGKNGYFVWRDTLRFAMVVILAPWTLLVFQARAQRLFARHINKRLDETLKGVDPKDMVIVSFGYRFIIEALLKGTRYEGARLVAPSVLDMVSSRKRGKMAMLASIDIVPNQRTDVVITDSEEDDRDLLDAVDEQHVIQWPDNHTRGALSDVYVPFYYTARIKRSPSFLLKQVFLEETLLVLLVFTLFVSLTITHVLSVLSLFAAYLLVYEIGYAENDKIGFKDENAPRLSSNFFRYQNYRIEPYAWIWAGLATALGVWLLDPSYSVAMLGTLGLGAVAGGFMGKTAIWTIWMGVLVLSRAFFWMFNHSPLRTRVFAYLPLHVTKYFGLAVLLPLHAVGFALLFAQVIRTWSLYAVRRAGGNENFIASQPVRFIFFSGMLGLLAFHDHTTSVFSLWQTWVLLGFCVVRAIPEVYRKLIKSGERSLEA